MIGHDETVVMPLPVGSPREIEDAIREVASNSTLFRARVVIFLLPEGQDWLSEEARKVAKVARSMKLRPEFAQAFQAPVLSDRTGVIGWGWLQLPAPLEEALAAKAADDPEWSAGEYVPPLPRHQQERAARMRRRVEDFLRKRSPNRILPLLETLCRAFGLRTD